MNDKPLGADLFPLYKGEPPFMKYVGGFGYIGVILQSRTTGKIQCHLCGKMYKSVARHIMHSHDTDHDTYTEMTQLNKYTPLVCEATSQKIRDAFTALSPAQKQDRCDLLVSNNKQVHQEGLYKRRVTKGRVQNKNNFGTCDLQAKHQFWVEYKQFGRVPTTDEMSGKLKNLVYTRFSDYHAALKSWGIGIDELTQFRESKNDKVVAARAKHNFYPKYEKETVTNQLRSFKQQHGQLPTWEEGRRAGIPTRSVLKRLFGTQKKSELEQIFV